MSSKSGALQLRSLIKPDGELEVSLVSKEIPSPADGEVVIQVQASPINPSDLGLLFGAADMSTARQSGSATQPVIHATVPQALMKAMAARMGQAMPVGNEGAGLVVAAGNSAAAQALLGKTVAVIGGAMYAQYRRIAADQCLVLPAGITAAQGASCFVNPLTSLGMTHTMRMEGHTALVHTAAASNLGKMLNRICSKDGIGLVNIVRNADQAAQLKALGAQWVCNSSDANFTDSLTDAIAATGATIAFDAIGGGKLPGQILASMEAALNRKATEYSRYGSTTHKQVYLYGSLDTAPTTFTRGFGMAWGIGGWLLFPFLNKIGPAATQALKDRVLAELTTTFASEYTREISLAQMLHLDEIAIYNKRATGTKYLVNPSKP